MQTIKLYIYEKTTVIPVLYTKQGDVGRKFKAIITDGTEGYKIPEDTAFSVWYSGASGEGNYSAIDGRSAFAISGNTVTVELITQMLNNKGGGKLCLIMAKADGTQIGTWNIPYVVEEVPGLGSKVAEQYYNSVEEVLAAAAKAEAAAAKAENAAGIIHDATDPVLLWENEDTQIDFSDSTVELDAGAENFDLLLFTFKASIGIDVFLQYMLRGNGTVLASTAQGIPSTDETVQLQEAGRYATRADSTTIFFSHCYGNGDEKDWLLIPAAIYGVPEKILGGGGEAVGISSIEQVFTSNLDGGENIIEVTMTNGEVAQFSVYNGSQGSPGYTPVKGTDYYTDDDKAEMVTAVLRALPTWEGGSY